MTPIQPQDTEARSADPVAANLAQLKQLFPEAFTEDALGQRIDFEVLRQLLGDAVTEKDEKYGLNWHGKKRARQLALTPSTGTLLPCPEESVDWATTRNLMIEGDNLEVLKLLQKSYAGKVKLIYIDPPYNTGTDFVYPDNFSDSIKNYLEITGQVEGGQKLGSNTEASGRFHTDWLNMLFPRLRLARDLLTADGVVLVSINDREVGNLRKIMDEVLGEENFVACLVWEKGRKNDAKLFSSGHEYVLVYAKSESYLREQKTLWREEKPGARDIWNQYLTLRAKHGGAYDRIESELQVWYSALPKAHPAKKWSRYKRIDRHGPWRDRDISWPGGGGPRYEVLHPVTRQPCRIPEAGWRYSTSSELRRQIELGLVEFRGDHTGPPFRKAHIRPIPEETDAFDAAEIGDEGEPEQEELATQVRGTYFYKQSQVSVKCMRDLLGSTVFNNPKDTEEIARLVRYTTSDDPSATVLDFFAGSGTTGEALMRLNAEDEGQRRCILVQLPEPLDPERKEQKSAADFCDEIGRPRSIAELTRERLRRAAQKISSEYPKTTLDLGFRVFKLAPSNIRAWNPDPDDLSGTLLAHAEHLVPGRTERDVLYEVLLKLGLDLTVPIATQSLAGKAVHSVGGGVLMVCLADGIDSTVAEELALGIAEWRKVLAPAGETVAVFKDSGFTDDVAKTNLSAILEQSGFEKKNIRSL